MRRAPIRRLRPLAALACASTLGACAVGPNYRTPPLPPGSGYGAAADDPLYARGQDVPDAWWSVFGSPDLDALVSEALRNSPTIAAADAALKAAREETKAQEGAFFPTVAASLQPSRQRVARTLSSPLYDNGFLYNLTTTQVSVGYAPDIFGANRRAVESLKAQAEQQRFEFEAARTTLATNVVQAAVQDALLRAEIDETRAIVAAQTKVLNAYRGELGLGAASVADVDAQVALLAQSQAAMPPLVKAFGVNRDLLADLVGRTPQEGPTTAFTLASLHMPNRLPLSLPGALVAQRPDVRAADAALHSASAEIGVAVAARLPNVELDAIGGSDALRLLPAFNATNTFWSLAGTLTQPIFQGGALRHKERAARDAFDQAAAQYRSTVVAAFQTTADTLHALDTDADAVAASERARAAADASLSIASRQAKLGDITRLAVLVDEQTDAQARLTQLQAQAAQLEDVAALFQALGGGWWNAPGAKTGGG